MLALAVVIFYVAALIHGEVLGSGYPDQGAAIAETVIGSVLLLGLLLTLATPENTRSVGLVVLGFGLLGTLVGLTLLLTVGPMTGLDLAIHVVMLVVLVVGLVITAQTPPSALVENSERSLEDANT